MCCGLNHSGDVHLDSRSTVPCSLLLYTVVEPSTYTPNRAQSRVTAKDVMDSGRYSTSPFISSLPVTTRSKLRSSQILTSIPQLVSELVQNSLDAGARNIDVSICLEDWECWVRDDGHGISRDGFAVLGGNSSPDGMRYGKSCWERTL